MAHGDIVASNDGLQESATRLRNYLLKGATLRLFKNDLHPTPKNPLGDFSEASFSGYARKSMNQEWGPVRKDEDGKYSFVSETIRWTGFIGATGHVVGWMLVQDAKVQFSARLPVEWIAANGKKLDVKVTLTVTAASIGCCAKCGG